MSTISGGAICVALNQYLAEVAGKSSPNMRRTKTGFLDSLISPLNTMGAQAVKVDQGNGQRKSVKIQYYQRQTESDVTSSPPASCDSSNEFALQETDYDIALKSYIDKKITSDYVSKICAGNGWAFGQVLDGMFEAMQRKINANLLAAAATSFGVNVSTGSASQVTIDLIDGTNGKIKADELTAFKDQIMNGNQFQANPIIAAGSNFFKANSLLQAGCCNDGGVDMLALTNQLGWSYFNDQQIDTEFGAGESVVYEPGSMQFVPWFKYRDLGKNVLSANGAYAAWESQGQGSSGILRDPKTGMAYNFKIVFNECDDDWTIILELNYDLWTMPTDIYSASDFMAGFNGVLDYKFT